MSAINELAEEDVELFTLSAKGSNNGHPHVALDAAHRLWFTWVRNQGRGDEIVVCRRDRETVGGQGRRDRGLPARSRDRRRA